MKNKNGFTVMELLVVIGILLILIAIVISSLSISQKKTRDDRRVSTLQEIMLALEQYRDVCREYPMGLDSAEDNGCPIISGVSATFGDFLSSDASSVLQQNTYGIKYVALKSSNASSNTCTGYHIGIPLESNHPELSRAEMVGTEGFGLSALGATYCDQNASGFWGNTEDCSDYFQPGQENRCLDFKKGNP
ncbi:MAG: prepilin-type N-terminal cleavage/methylation domain-containing protein [Candidatus Pacebacteria bacterium]|nr:prepilin-type N-terminal cleavage/methylation domain-containing protein [Candidatus Paceibacterota bacterium]